MREAHHCVYVVQLDEAVMQERKFVEANPHFSPSKNHKTPLYVGMTGVPVEQRFQNHMSGYKSSRYVQKYGVRLLPDLYEHLNPMMFEEAVEMEKECAERLRKVGHPVWQR